MDLSRDDCGMAIVRWLCLEPRSHLKKTQFYIHSHNANAASIMVMQMFVAGFQVEGRPFGTSVPSPAEFDPLDETEPEKPGKFGWLRSLFDYLAGRKPGTKANPE